MAFACVVSSAPIALVRALPKLDDEPALPPTGDEEPVPATGDSEFVPLTPGMLHSLWPSGPRPIGVMLISGG